jgi:hypothetical protein
MTSRATVLEMDDASRGDKDARSDRGKLTTRRYGRRHERSNDNSEDRDKRPIPAEIKSKTITHLLLTDPLRQYSRWHHSLNSHLINADPMFGNLLEGEESDWLYHYELALARLPTALVKEEEAAYLVSSTTRRNKQSLGTAALAALSDAYQYDPLDHFQRLKAELHRPI